MITENKVIEIFCMADDFCKFFDTMMTKYTLPSTTKRKYHRDSTMSILQIPLMTNSRIWHKWNIQDIGLLIISLSTSWVQSQLTAVSQRSRVSMFRERLIHSLPYFKFVELTLVTARFFYINAFITE